MPVITATSQVFDLKTCIFRQTHSYILVEWENFDYNLGNFFDGTYFTVPENGLYSFYACCRQQSSNYGQIHLDLNNNLHIYADRAESNNKMGFVNIDTTLNLVKNDKVDVRFNGNLYCTNDSRSTYFEGRMIARLDEWNEFFNTNNQVKDRHHNNLLKIFINGIEYILDCTKISCKNLSHRLVFSAILFCAFY